MGPAEPTTFLRGNGTSQTTNPDGGVLKEYFAEAASGGSILYDQLAYKTEQPDGTVVERKWQLNKPNIPHSGNFNTADTVNAYVKTEFTSIRNAAGTLSKTAIRDYTYDKNGNVTQVNEYDWVDYGSVARDGNGNPTGAIPGSAVIKRVLVNTWHNPTPTASDSTTNDPETYCKPTSPRLKNAIESNEVRSDTPTSAVLARTEYAYDNPSTTGNLMTEKSWDSTKGAISRPLNGSNSISATHTYDGFGNRTSTTDAKSVQTKYTLDGNNLYVIKVENAFGTTVKRTAEFVNDLSSGLVTESKDSDNNVRTLTTYDVFGRPTLAQEAYATAIERRTSTEYSDASRRVIVRSDLNATGDGKLVTINHYDQLGRVRLTRKLEDAAAQSPYLESDGIKVQTRYRYDATGFASYDLVSSPYRAGTSDAATSEPGMGWKRVKYDKGGRTIGIETFIGTTLPSPWANNNVSSGKVATEYDAEHTKATDQAGKVRRSRVDGLGRLVRVDEPDGSGNLGTVTSPAQPTHYTYNALGNLTQTSQTGVPNGGGSSITQTRTFNYSSLGRLTSAVNPESGTISYQYDANGNLTKKTDARSVFIDYTYDELNRNRTLDYSNTAVSPDITRIYDNATAGAFGKGKLWKDYAGGDQTNGTEVEHREYVSYDALGRPLSVKQQFKAGGVWSGAFTTSQSYNLADGVTGKTHPSTRTLSYSYDADGDLITFSGTLGDGVNRTYASGIQYNAQGQMIREQFGTSKALYHRRHYNSRGQMFDVRLGTDSSTVNDGADPAAWTGKSWNYGALRLYYSSNQTDYSWPFTTGNAPQHNNGNLYRLDYFVPTALDGSDNITAWGLGVDYYGYDSLNRVTGVTEQTYDSAGGFNPATFSQQFSYDRFGNRLVSSSNVPNVPNPVFKINGPTNRLIASTDVDGSNVSDKMRYDAAGNQIKDTHTQTGTTGTRAYDAENRMTAADGTNGLANGYIYNADGKRTRRSIDSGGAVWWHVYGIGGELVAEYRIVSGVPTLKKEYGYRNGELLVVWDGDETGDKRWQWRMTDQLGTARMLVDLSGAFASMKRRDYLPFGEEILAGVGHRTIGNGYPGALAANPRQHFTGKERDKETALDYFEARYYGSVYGRFISVDPGNHQAWQDLSYPQSWNAYVYVNNNPLRYIDPDGNALNDPGLWQQLKEIWYNGTTYGYWMTNAELRAAAIAARTQVAVEFRRVGSNGSYLPIDLSRKSDAEALQIRDALVALRESGKIMSLGELVSDGSLMEPPVWLGGTQNSGGNANTPNPANPKANANLAKKADDLISGKLKKAHSYHSELGQKTYKEILELAKKGGAEGKAAQDMKKLIEQGERLRKKVRGK